MGHKIESYDGYTIIDVPGEKGLHCDISVDEGTVTLRFIDYAVAKDLLEQIVKNQFRGFRLDERAGQ